MCYCLQYLHCLNIRPSTFDSVLTCDHGIIHLSKAALNILILSSYSAFFFSLTSHSISWKYNIKLPLRLSIKVHKLERAPAPSSISKITGRCSNRVFVLERKFFLNFFCQDAGNHCIEVKMTI